MVQQGSHHVVTGRAFADASILPGLAGARMRADAYSPPADLAERVLTRCWANASYAGYLAECRSWTRSESGLCVRCQVGVFGGPRLDELKEQA